MGANLLQVKDKVQRYLSEKVNHIELTPEGAFTFRNGSTRVWVNVAEHGESTILQKILSAKQTGQCDCINTHPKGT